MQLSFTVQGRPQPQGSTRAFIPKGWVRPIITTDNKTLKPWRQDVSSQAILAMEGREMCQTAVGICCKFYFLRPKSDRKRVVHKTTKPDIDKLLRAVFDALTGICYRDDSQISVVESHKLFCDSNERVEIEVLTI